MSHIVIPKKGERGKHVNPHLGDCDKSRIDDGFEKTIPLPIITEGAFCQLKPSS
ncbi:MAG: hypothetical protein NZ901_06290 [Geminocystis sp.]|nr:hypothetical protein [Geminocystis sp.]HIK38443.1 hypothetical protein [Geminocystis sp. M7585_C2015_104]MCS7147788.1 hypothetical protein [Geminocystis sp.]MCX8079192.1 hypothetical protein [Geminocystis sp.]MDW8116638.1 hypothetical protein [Geminocystis sp.]